MRSSTPQFFAFVLLLLFVPAHTFLPTTNFLSNSAASTDRTTIKLSSSRRDLLSATGAAAFLLLGATPLPASASYSAYVAREKVRSALVGSCATPTLIGNVVQATGRLPVG